MRQRQRLRLRLRQGHHLRALEEPAQVAVLRPLKDNVQLVAVDEGSFKPDDTRVRRQRLQQLDLLDAPLSRLRIHRVEDRDLLERHSLRVAPSVGRALRLSRPSTSGFQLVTWHYQALPHEPHV